MKKLLIFTTLLLIAQIMYAQEDKSKRPSPPAQAKQTVGSKTITIDYSQPSVKGRSVWDPAGKVAPIGKVWRTGANETTTIEFSDDVKLEGKSVPKGKYALFTIPGEKDWTVIINKGIKWGAFTYKEEEDVVRVTVPSKKAKSFQEKFKIDISKKGDVAMVWADTEVDFNVK
ncbi:DUF2911 domain-containing protein [Larkinella terrae]|uniref:DUF2911 domain-containing protein n=1 Tax=Larkinella terrae TaxID=2025311 RepID=A0A7K0EME3_9BACT|nr:DUF2911 domain-containing protein [Larkinella terrae]MRS63010.1 DUF2911 domain-containing protein [Larkinella terrae]